MKRNTVVILCMFSASFFAAWAQGSVYYVDGSHPQANNANPGTASQPWLTIQHAADTVRAGDTVIVKEGMYKERIRFSANHSGAKDRSIVFKAQPRRSVTMWGFYTRYCNYLRIEGFSIIADSSLTNWTDAGGVFIHSDFVEVVDNYFFELSVGIRSYWHEPYPKGGSIAGNRIYRCQSGMSICGIDWLIENNEVERLIWRGSGDADYSRLFGENITFRRNRFHGSKVNEIGAAHVDCWQTFTNNGEYLRNALIEANICEQCHQGLMASNVDTTDCRNIIFRNNLFHDCWAWGLCIYDISNFTVENNTFVNIKYHAAGFNGNSKGNIVRNNIFYNANSGYWVKDGGEVTADYNLFFKTKNGIPAPHNLPDTDPLFADTANNDFRLKKGSPAIDKGAALTAVAADIAGTKRPKGNGWDIGAYEYDGDMGTIGVPDVGGYGKNGFQVAVIGMDGKVCRRAVRVIYPSIVSVYDIFGRLVAGPSVQPAQGMRTFVWDGADGRGNRCAPGCYSIRLRTTGR